MDYTQTRSKIKKVHFNKTCYVYLIPDLNDEIYYKFKNDIWWSKYETNIIKLQAIKEYQKICLFNKEKDRVQLSKTMWSELDFDEIYKLLDAYKLTHKIELKKLCELYVIKSCQ